MLKGSELKRYMRHIELPKMGVEGQKKIKEASVFICGVGGLGNISAMYLAASGVGHIGIADGDNVDLSNLQRQIFFKESDVGVPKVKALEASIKKLRSDVRVTKYDQFLNEEDLFNLKDNYDVVLDGSDNFETKHSLNKFSLLKRVKYVSASVHNYSGQVATFHNDVDEAPCYSCCFPQETTEHSVAPKCSEAGVLGPLVGVIASMQASEAIKLIVNDEKNTSTDLIMLSLLNNEFSKLKIQKNLKCSVCNK